MGKNRNRESLIRIMTNTIVHEIVVKYTNKPESENFLNSEIIEYRGQAENTAEKHNWNNKDIEEIRKKVLKKIKEKMRKKYTDISFLMKEAEELLKKEIGKLLDGK